jgi:hypothetical protein
MGVSSGEVPQYQWEAEPGAPLKTPNSPQLHTSLSSARVSQ